MIWLIAWVLCLSLSTLSLSSDHLEIDSEDGGRKLFDSGQIRSFHFTTNGEYCTNPLTANKYPFSCKNQKRVLVIPQNFPVPTLHGSDKRCFHVLESLRALNHYVGLIPFSRASVKPGDDDKSLLSQLKVEFFAGYLMVQKSTKGNSSALYTKILEDFKPDIVITWLWFWEMKMTAPGTIIPITRQFAPNVKIVVFTDDVHSKRERQIAEQFKNFNAFDHYIKRSQKMLKVERIVYSASDSVVCISDSDRRDIAVMDHAADPNAVFAMRYIASPWDIVSDPRSILGKKPDVPGFATRKNLVFVGNGENPTNIHAIKWYLESLAQEMSKGIPGVKLLIVGQSWDAFREAQPDSEKYIIFLGPLSTEDMNLVIDKAKVFVAPIRASTGINTKNVLALGRGIPLVTTPAGSAGICSRCDDWILFNPLDPFGETKPATSTEIPMLMGRDNYDFVAQVKLLYYNELKWREYSAAGPKHVKLWFGLKEATVELDNILAYTFDEKKNTRGSIKPPKKYGLEFIPSR
jgi:glycosyltransferase involved in cell wall biosynthesis